MQAIAQTHDSSLTDRDITATMLTDFFTFLDATPKTASTYQRALRQLFRYFAEHSITRPAFDDIVNFKKTLDTAGRKASTIALYLAAAKKFFTWTAQRGLYPNITEGVKAPKQDKGHKRDFLGVAQLTRIFAGMPRITLQEKRDYAIVVLMSVGGLRTVEISRANIEDMRTLGECTVLYVQGKGRNDRTEFVKLPEPVLQAVTDYLNARGRNHKPACTAPLFASIGNRNKGGRMTTRTISQIAKSAMREAGYDSSRLTAHSLRHSAVTLSLLGGMTLSETQAFARHSNIATTLIYAHNVDRIKSMCENTICNMIFTNAGGINTWQKKQQVSLAFTSRTAS